MGMAVVFNVGVRGECTVTAVGYAETGLQSWECEWTLILLETLSQMQREQRGFPHSMQAM